MAVVPAAIPVTIPVPEPVVAMAELLLLQVPPDNELNKVVADPEQRKAEPVMADGEGFTVIVSVT
jgi:hypothetical protein